MSFTTPHSTQPSMGPPQDREMLIYASHVNSWTLDAYAGSSTLEATPGYDQIETWLFLVQMGQQPNFPPNETQSQVIGGHFAIQSATEDRRNRTTGSTGRPRHACLNCSRDFGRTQELIRHVMDRHDPPHRCPFSSCAFTWTRPNKLKEHLLADHEGGFSPEILEAIKPLRGPNFIKFLNDYIHRLNAEATLQPVVQVPLTPSQF